MGGLIKSKIKHLITTLSNLKNIFNSQNIRDKLLVWANFIVAEIVTKKQLPIY